MAKFDPTKFDKWLLSEMKKELKRIPIGIRKSALKNKDGFDIVLDSVCRRLAFNSKDATIRKLFGQALKESVR